MLKKKKLFVEIGKKNDAVNSRTYDRRVRLK